MLPGLAKRSHASPWHFGHTLGATTTSCGSKPQQRHWSWKTSTRLGTLRNASYVAKRPSDAKRSMLMDMQNSFSPRVTYSQAQLPDVYCNRYAMIPTSNLFC